MAKMIDFGIDLGTTNSLVAKFNKGVVEVFKNPIGFKESLPSVVGFRNDRILVGEQARVYAEKDPKNVVSRFKRKMGTTESFKIKALGQSKTPVELSALLLKELKTFIHTGEVPEAVVLTVPASFDMVQSHATKEAGYAAGFKQVVLLQEPIAASLAYANTEKGTDLKNSQWIVYDLGGGTFDVALVKIVEGELKVVDHEGDNYLGGADFDAMIVEQIIVPQLEEQGKFTDLLAQMKSATGKYNTTWHALLRLAEEAKIELSARQSAEIDLGRINVEDEDGKTIDRILDVTRSEFEALIKDAVDGTAEMLRTILTRNSLRPQDLMFVLMVGGSTYIPFVRRRIGELLELDVNTRIDPTNAVAVGAAYFAATKEIDLGAKPSEKPKTVGQLRLKVAYNRFSQEREELFGARVEGDVKGLFYRITRQDGGYDSGLKELTPRISEDLPLQEDAFNVFTFKVYDGQNNPVPTNVDDIQIKQGGIQGGGQTLPYDLSLVKDDLGTGDTTLECLFAKNTVLPARTKKTVETNKTILQGSGDEVIRIIVVEGPSENHFTENKKQGELVITGGQLQKDLHRHTDIDLTFEVSESRDLTVTAYINPSGPEFKQIFLEKYREVDVLALSQEVQMLQERLEKEKADALRSENYEVIEKLEALSDEVETLAGEAALLSLTPDDVTDDRYKIDDRKRKAAQELGRLTSGKRIERLRTEYETVKEEATDLVTESGNDHERRQLHEVVTRESTFLNSTNPKKLEAAITQLRGISFGILRRKPEFLIGWFQYLIEKREMLNDQLQAKNLIEAGKKHIAAEDYDKLLEVNGRLHSLLPQEEKDSAEMRRFTGIS